MTTIDQFQALAAAAKAIGADYSSNIGVSDELVANAATLKGACAHLSVYEPNDERPTWTAINSCSVELLGVWVTVSTARRAATTEEIEGKKRHDLETAALMARIAARETEAA